MKKPNKESITLQISIALRQAIESANSFKAKHLKPDSFLSLLTFKLELEDYLDKMGRNERECAKACGIEVTTAGFAPPANGDGKDFYEKLEAVQKIEFSPSKIQFISQNEFDQWAEEASTGTKLILCQYLMKR